MKKAKKYNILFLSALIFILSTIYLYGFGNYLFFYQENIKLFVYSSDYFHGFIIRPGGLLEYAGNFLDQGYFNTLYGSMVLSLIITLLVPVTNILYKEMTGDDPAPLFFIVIPPLLLLLIQVNFNWFLWSDIGLLLTLLYFLFTIIRDKKRKHVVSLILFPFFYYLTGAFALIYLLLYLVYYSVFTKGVDRFLYPAILLIISLLTFFVSKEYIFLQPVSTLLLSPFSLKNQFIFPGTVYLLIGFLILCPLFVKFLSLLHNRIDHIPSFTKFSVLSVFILFSLAMYLLYNPKAAKLFKLEKDVYTQNWSGLIKHQEKYQLSNIVAQYYYNVALTEKGQLCDRMFFGKQEFGTKALIIPWETRAGTNNIARGVYLYYAVGLINEAHRWAYESMVVQGYRPENLKLLVKTNLINGHYKITEKYIKILKNTLHYRKWAKKYEAMLYRPDLIKSDPELGEKLKLIPQQNFTIRFNSPLNNILLLWKTNPANKRAYECILAWYLLEKNISEVIKKSEKIKEMSYKRIPRHVEEALVIYYMNTGTLPDLGNLKISKETIQRFGLYETLVNPHTRSKLSNLKKIQKAMKKTYWFYFDYIRR